MKTIQEIERGVALFIDREMVPIMPKAKGIAFAAFAPMVVKAKIKEYAPLVQTMGLLDGESIDVDAVYGAFKGKAQGKWPLEVFGFKFAETDLDKLYQTIKEA